MKTVVLELKNGQAAVLDTEGIVHIVEDHAYQVGYVLDLNEQDFIEETVVGRRGRGTARMETRIRRALIPAAAALAVAVIGGGGAAAYALPAGTVTIDVNPSFKYSLNLFDQVLSVTSYDEEDAELAEEIESLVKGRRIGKAVETTFDKLNEKEYIMDSETPVVITVNSPILSETGIEENLSQEVVRWNETHAGKGEEASVDLTIERVSRDVIRKADAERISPGREMLRQKQEEKGRRNGLPEIEQHTGDAVTSPEENKHRDLAAEGQEGENSLSYTGNTERTGEQLPEGNGAGQDTIASREEGNEEGASIPEENIMGSEPGSDENKAAGADPGTAENAAAEEQDGTGEEPSRPQQEGQQNMPEGMQLPAQQQGAGQRTQPQGQQPTADMTGPGPGAAQGRP